MQHQNYVVGRLYHVGDIVQVKENFLKREFVVETETYFNNGSVRFNYIPFQLLQSNCDRIERFKIGDEIKVTFDLGGNRWDKDGVTRYFATINAWKIEPANAPTQQPDNWRQQYSPGAGYSPAPAPAQQPGVPDESDLPF